MKISRSIFALTAVFLGVGFAACDTPDPQGRFDEFGAKTKDLRGGTTDTCDADAAQQIDFSGTYFLSIRTPIAPATPLYFQTKVTVDENFVADFEFQPLKVDTNAAPRTPVGDPLIANDVQLQSDGTFELTLTDAHVSGEANPISGGNIVVTFNLTGYVISSTSFYGTVDGQVSEPTQLSLAGSTFGAIIPEVEDLTLVTPVAACETETPDDDAGDDTDAGDAGDMDMGTPPKVRCPEGLAGDYVLTFKADIQSTRNQVKITLVESTDDTLCYTGKVLSLTDGSELGDVEYFREADGTVQALIPNFAIPPGASTALPDGGEARLELTATHWTTEGACGELMFSLVGLSITSAGDFAAIRENSTKFTVADSETAATCEDIMPNEPCGLDAFAGTYNFKFITNSTVAAGGSPTLIDLNLETNPLTCLSGTWVSKTGSYTLATVQYAEPADTEATFYVRNFTIPPDPTNPISFLQDGGLADATFTSITSVPGTSMCGSLTVNLLEPIATDSPGTFSADASAEPREAGCPP